MKRHLLIAFLLLAPTQALAQGSPQPTPKEQMDEAAKAAEQAAKDLISIMGIMLRSIPQYEMPEILENGDILIRRVPKEPAAPDAAPPADGSKI